jgi:PAS domain S-box-containing protein
MAPEGITGSAATASKQVERWRGLESLILAQTSDAVVVIDNDHRVTYWNAAAERVYGVTAAEAIGQALESLYTYEWANPEGIWRGENIHIRRDGGRIHVHSTVNVLPASAGGGLLAVIRDITRQKQTELEAARERTLLHAVTGVAPVLLYIYDLVAARNVWINDALPSILGYDSADLDRMGPDLLSQLLHPDDALRYPAHHERLRELGNQETALFEYRMRHRNGSWIWLSSHERAYSYDAQGKVIQIVGAAQDTTQRRNAEEEISRASRLLQTIVDSTPDLVWVKDPGGRMTFANRAAIELLGNGDRERVIGGDSNAIIPDPEHARRVAANDARIVQSGIAETVEEEFGTAADPLIFQSTKSPLRDEAGRVAGLVGVSRDVTEERRAQRRLHQNEERQRYLLKLSDALRPLTDPAEIQRVASRILGDHLSAHRVLYAEIDGDEATVHEAYTNGLPALSGKFQVRDFGEGIIEAYNRGELIHYSDIPNDKSLSGSVKQAFEQLGVRSNLSCGLLKDGRWVAALVVHQAAPRVWSALEIALFEETAERTWAAVERARAERRLEESQKTLQSFYDSAPVMMGLAELSDDHTVAVSGNSAIAEFFGIKAEDIPGRTGRELGTPPALERLLVENYRRSQREAKPVQFEFEHRTRSGSQWLSATVAFVGMAGSGRPRFSFVVEDITDRKVAEEQLQRAAERAEIAQRAASAILYEITVKTGEIYRSGLIKDLLGYSNEEIEASATGWFALVHPGDLPQLDAAFNASLENASDLNLEYRVRHREGHWIWVADHARVVTDANGATDRIVGFVSDITKRRQIQASLEESEARFRLMADGIPNLIWVMDAAGQLVFINEAYRKFCGISDQDVTQDGWQLVLHPDDKERYVSEYMRSVREQRDFYSQCRVRRADGAWRWIASYGTARFSAAGEFLGHVGSSPDIHDLVTAQEALRESEERFRQLAENMSQFAWMTRPDGHIYWYNRRWFEYTGTTLEEMEGWGWQKVHHPDYVEGVTARFRRAVEAGEPWEDTFPLRGADGNYRWFLSRAVPIRDHNGAIVRWFGTNTDVTHQLEIERDLRRANEDLEQFAYSASHDLQEPLRTVSVYSDLLEREYSSRLDGKALTFLHNIAAGSRRMHRLISDLLLYTRVGSRDETPAELIDTQAILDTAIANVEQSIRAAKAQISIEPLPRVYVRPAHLQSVFQNLLANAVKYGKDGEPPRIRVSAAVEGDFAKFSVADNGIGIASAFHQTVFGVFKRLHGSAEKYTGTGIGLAVSKRIVEGYGGRIWVESEPGKGSVFYFTLPTRGVAKS